MTKRSVTSILSAAAILLAIGAVPAIAHAEAAQPPAADSGVLRVKSAYGMAETIQQRDGRQGREGGEAFSGCAG